MLHITNAKNRPNLTKKNPPLKGLIYNLPMDEKYDEKYEKKIVLLAESRLKSGNYKVFDYRARVIKRAKIPELVSDKKSEKETALVIINSDGETVVITEEFEMILRNAVK